MQHVNNSSCSSNCLVPLIKVKKWKKTMHMNLNCPSLRETRQPLKLIITVIRTKTRWTKSISTRFWKNSLRVYSVSIKVKILHAATVTKKQKSSTTNSMRLTSLIDALYIVNILSFFFVFCEIIVKMQNIARKNQAFDFVFSFDCSRLIQVVFCLIISALLQKKLTLDGQASFVTVLVGQVDECYKISKNVGCHFYSLCKQQQHSRRASAIPTFSSQLSMTAFSIVSCKKQKHQSNLLNRFKGSYIHGDQMTIAMFQLFSELINQLASCISLLSEIVVFMFQTFHRLISIILSIHLCFNDYLNKIDSNGCKLIDQRYLFFASLRANKS